MKDGIGSALGASEWKKLDSKDGSAAPVNKDARFNTIAEAKAAIEANKQDGEAYLISEDTQGKFVVLEKDVSKVVPDPKAPFNPVSGATYFAATTTNAGTAEVYQDVRHDAAQNKAAFHDRFPKLQGKVLSGPVLDDALPPLDKGHAAEASDSRTMAGNPGGVMGLQMEINEAIADDGHNDLVKTDGKFGAETLSGLRRALPKMLNKVDDPSRLVALLKLAYGDNWKANPAAQRAITQAMEKSDNLPKLAQLVSLATAGGTQPLSDEQTKMVDAKTKQYLAKDPLPSYGPAQSQMLMSNLIKVYGSEAKIPPDVRQAADDWSCKVIGRAKNLGDLQGAQKPYNNEPIPTRLSPTVQKAFDAKVAEFIDKMPLSKDGAGALTKVLIDLYPSGIPADILKKRDDYDARCKAP